MKFILNLNEKIVKTHFFESTVVVFFACGRFLFFGVLLFIYACGQKDDLQTLPTYKVIKCFSEKIHKKEGLVLYAYGVNNYLPKDYVVKNGIANYSLSYYLFKTREDRVSLQEARELLVTVVEDFLLEVNSNSDISSLLDRHPFSADSIDISIHFKDENYIDLGQGISTMYYSDGKIKYERYDIHEYRSKYPSIGEHFTVHTESYAEALDIVKNKGCTIDFHASALMPESCSDFFLSW